MGASPPAMDKAIACVTGGRQGEAFCQGGRSKSVGGRAWLVRLQAALGIAGQDGFMVRSWTMLFQLNTQFLTARERSHGERMSAERDGGRWLWI